ncbi:hypothetical protein [Actinokineospora sp. NPDC004072]
MSQETEPGSSSTAAPPPAAAAHPAVEAYLAMWRDVAAASATSDWRGPQLDDHASGTALAAITDALRNDHDKGLVAKGQPTHTAKLSPDQAATETTAVVVDCADSTGWLKFRADNGQLADETPGGRRSITAEVILSAGGEWKVSRFIVQEIGSCP